MAFIRVIKYNRSYVTQKELSFNFIYNLMLIIISFQIVLHASNIEINNSVHRIIYGL